MVKEMQTAFPVLSKQKKPFTKLSVDIVAFQVSASPEKKRIFFSSPPHLFLPPFPSGFSHSPCPLLIDTGIEKGGNAERELMFSSQKKHVDLCILQFTYFFSNEKSFK